MHYRVSALQISNHIQGVLAGDPAARITHPKNVLITPVQALIQPEYRKAQQVNFEPTNRQQIDSKEARGTGGASIDDKHIAHIGC
jgi:hypothetical protein